MSDTTHHQDSIEIQQYMIVCQTPKWLLTTENVAVATAVTDDGQVFEGIGASRWSTDSAIDAAIDHARSMSGKVDFNYQITKVRVGQSNATFERIEDAAFRKGENHLTTASSKVWIRAQKDDRAVQATGKAYFIFSQVRRALQKALDDASADFQRLDDL